MASAFLGATSLSLSKAEELAGAGEESSVLGSVKFCQDNSARGLQGFPAALDLCGCSRSTESSVGTQGLVPGQCPANASAESSTCLAHPWLGDSETSNSQHCPGAVPLLTSPTGNFYWILGFTQWVGLSKICGFIAQLYWN